jgi:hypothetical protein
MFDCMCINCRCNPHIHIKCRLELLTLPEHPSPPPVFSGVRVTRSVVLCVCFVDRCLSFWPLCCLFYFDLRILITLLVSSNSSYISKLTICNNIFYKAQIFLVVFVFSAKNYFERFEFPGM